MEWTSLFVDVLKLSPFVAALLYFLMTVWNSMQKKDEALTATMRDHSANMLALQKESILAQNNAADSNRQLAGSIGQLSESQAEVLKEIRDLRTLKLNGSRLKSAVETKPAVA